MSKSKSEEKREGRSELAVIVPVYNNAATLPHCLDSILGQTKKDLEVVLVDDGSQDESGEICDRAKESDSRVHVIHKENEGLMATWMRGVSESTSPCLAFVDADDWIDNEMFSSLMGSLLRDQGRIVKRQVVCCGYQIEREGKKESEVKGNGAPPGIYEGEKLQNKIKDRLLGNEVRTVIASRCMKVFTRDLIENNMHFCDPSIRMGEDLNITTPALLDAKRIVLMNEPYYHYVFYHDSMVHAYDAALYENMVKLRKKLLSILMEKEVPSALEMAEREYLFLFCIELKNELRRVDVGKKEVVSRVRELCAREHTGELVRFYPEKVRDPANKILIWMMRNPTSFRVKMARKIFLMQSNGKGKKDQ